MSLTSLININKKIIKNSLTNSTLKIKQTDEKRESSKAYFAASEHQNHNHLTNRTQKAPDNPQ